MKKSNKTGIWLFAVMIVGLTATAAFAFSGMGKGMFGGNEAAQAAMEAGDYEAWKAAHLSDLTQERFDGIRSQHAERAAHHDAVEAALESGDLAAWKEAMGNTPMAESMTEDGFAVMQQIHEAMEEGDVETARTLQEELHESLGIGMPGFGQGKGMRGSRGMGGCSFEGS